MTLPAQLPMPFADIPEPIPLHLNCLCPACYFIATEGEMCLRCTYEGCDPENNHHG